MDLCALCGDVIRPQDDALITPDFLADDTDPLWRFADAPMQSHFSPPNPPPAARARTCLSQPSCSRVPEIEASRI